MQHPSWRSDCRARKINVRRAFLPLCALAVLSLVGCAGGSSGFDLRPAQRAEQALIEEVTASGQCADFEGMLICGAALPLSGPPGGDLCPRNRCFPIPWSFFRPVVRLSSAAVLL